MSKEKTQKIKLVIIMLFISSTSETIFDIIKYTENFNKCSQLEATYVAIYMVISNLHVCVPYT